MRLNDFFLSLIFKCFSVFNQKFLEKVDLNQKFIKSFPSPTIQQ